MMPTLYDRAQRYVGIHELAGDPNHPLIQWWLSLCFDGKLDLPDATPWCSAFANGIAWEERAPRSKSAAARSWLKVGVPVSPQSAMVGYDVVILKRGGGGQPGPEVLNAPGHVGFFAGWERGNVVILGGNQGDSVCLAQFRASDILGVRRLVT